jgi:hypothetical protein
VDVEGSRCVWLVDNFTPFAAERGWVRDRNGAEVWLVAVKCTFDIKPDGSLEVSAAQPPVLRVPEYNGEPGQSSLKYEADLVLTKTTTDIIVIGHAYPPGGRAATEVDTGFRVGPVQKVLRIFGDRTWSRFGVSEPQPFVKMPLLFERAFGGVDRRSAYAERDWDPRNPVGTGFAVARDHITGVRLPNIEYPNEPVTAWRQRPRPAGVGVVGPHWQPRAGFAGTYDDKWLKERQPLLPDDFDERFFQCAPQDQQAPEFLRGGDPVIIRNMTPSGDLRFLLPRIFLGFDTRFYDGTRSIHRERRLHTVILEPDYPRVSLVWHSALSCHFKVQQLERTIVTLKNEVGRRMTLTEADEFELA